jgi:undecaprenyl-diphosphatase
LARPKEGKQIGLVGALVIGAAQAVAMLPGISRSGSTISTGMYLGIQPTEAARFSFLLALPAIAGATLLQSVDLVRVGIDASALLPLIIGTVVSFGSGVLAIKMLLGIIGKGKFGMFAYYCLVVGTIGILFI